MRIAATVATTVLVLLSSLAPLAAQTLRTYEIHQTVHPPKIDGKLNDPAWQSAPWTPDFLNIATPNAAAPGPDDKPPYRTRAKLLWDSQYLYIAAELSEPDIRAAMTAHDSPLYQENNFEWFLKPFADNPGYFEFEINARKTTWDLYLDKAYKEGGKADSSWEIPGLLYSVRLNGTLNKSDDQDKSWTVELAIPWTALATRLPVKTPTVGTEWRANLMRVEHPSPQHSFPATATSGPPNHPENYSVWSPLGIPDMHAPERWGTVRFVGPAAP